ARCAHRMTRVLLAGASRRWGRLVRWSLFGRGKGDLGGVTAHGGNQLGRHLRLRRLPDPGHLGGPDMTVPAAEERARLGRPRTPRAIGLNGPALLLGHLAHPTPRGKKRTDDPVSG